MILVVGRPGLDQEDRLDRLAGSVARQIAATGTQVELVGSVGDDVDGEEVALALGRAEVGHAALLRDPAGVTPRAGGPGGPLPRLDREDVALGLSYLVECSALVVAESLPADVMQECAGAATYHSAPLIAVVDPGQPAPTGLPADATVLERPSSADSPFSQLVASYAVAVSGGASPEQAWATAVRRSGFEPVDGSQPTGSDE